MRNIGGREPPVQSGGRRANTRRCPRRVAIKIRNVVRRPDARDVTERAALCRVAAIVRDARATRFSRDSVRLDASLSRTLYGYLRVTTCLFSSMNFDAMKMTSVSSRCDIPSRINVKSVAASPIFVSRFVVVGPLIDATHASALAVTIAR